MSGLLERQFSVEQFYYREARFLDSRQYRQWLALVSTDIHYLMPSRANPQVDNRQRDSEALISVENELERSEGMGSPLREERYAHLYVRVERAYKINSWAENPPARTRRIVGNVEVLEDDGGLLSVISNFHLYYARPGSSDFIYSGQRNDRLMSVDDGYRIVRREIVMDYATIHLPTLSLLL